MNHLDQVSFSLGLVAVRARIYTPLCLSACVCVCGVGWGVCAGRGRGGKNNEPRQI